MADRVLVDSDIVNLVSELILRLQQVDGALGELLLNGHHAGNIGNDRGGDLLPEDLAVPQHQDNVEFFESYRSHLTLKLVGPTETIGD